MTDNEADLISIAAGYLPEGYVLVPVEPTEKMVEVISEITSGYSIKGATYLYKAMIQASQEEG